MSATPGIIGPGSLQGSAGRRRSEATVRAVLMGAAILSVLISAGIIASLIVEAVSFLTQIDLADLFAPGWFPRRGMFSIPTVLAGTLIVTGIAMLLAAPIGLLSAMVSAVGSTHSPPASSDTCRALTVSRFSS